MTNIDILLVEDNEADAVLMREALKEAQLANVLHVVCDGQAAVSFLHGDETVNPMSVVPSLVVLDLNIPKLSGMEVLAEIKQDTSLCAIPVVMMTSSTNDADVARAYDLEVNSYVTKPSDFNELIEVTKRIKKLVAAA